MTNFIPIFPLGIVVYPGEELNLHIFESRYKQLIKDCSAAKKPFGIPAVINNKMTEMGMIVEIIEITNEYDTGEMDIKTLGIKPFRILEIIKNIPDKMYDGAIVNYPANDTYCSEKTMQPIIETTLQLHKYLNVNKNFKKKIESLTSYDVAHHVGLSLEEEYELLTLLKELQRQEYLKQHLAKVLPVMAEMENLKDRIQLNGHFKNLEGFNL